MARSSGRTTITDKEERLCIFYELLSAEEGAHAYGGGQ